MKARRFILTLFIQIFVLSSVFAQITDTLVAENLDSLINLGKICFDPVPENDSIYLHVEKMPKFPGGVNALRRYIATNIKYPKNSGCIQGSVYLRFEIKKTGEIGKVELLRGVDSLLDKEAIRVIKSLPKFNPGRQGGKPVNVWYLMPINMHLN